MGTSNDRDRKGRSMVDISVEFAGLAVENPFLLAAGPVTEGAEGVMEAFDAGWAGAVMSTVALNPVGAPAPARYAIRSGATRWGEVAFDERGQRDIADMADQIAVIRRSFPDRPLFASLGGGGDSRLWRDATARLQDAGVSGFEINGGWPNFSRAHGAPRELAGDPGALASAVGWLRSGTELPIFVKLSPNVTKILPLAEAALGAGASGFTATSGLSAIGGLDLEHLTPADPSGRLIGTYTGIGLRPVALRWTAELARALPTPVIGCGGVERWEDAAEFLAVGAAAVQVDMAVEWEGPDIIHGLVGGLRDYLIRKGFRSLSDLRGRALPNIVGFDDLDLDVQMLAIVDEERCTGCDVCLRACHDGGYQAMERVGEIVRANPLKCDGCGLCVYVCPANAVEMVRKAPA
jgi:dihydropyrimidine dehydrogenase (NAD+) subunit PreA